MENVRTGLPAYKSITPLPIPSWFARLGSHSVDRESSLTAGRARQSSARHSVACSGAQRTDAPYPLSLTGCC